MNLVRWILTGASLAIGVHSTIAIGETADSLDTAGGLAQICDDDAETADRLYCYGYFRGFVVGYAYGAPRISFCPPAKVNYEQAVAVYTRWASNNPEKWHIKPAAAILESLEEAFPCRVIPIE